MDFVQISFGLVGGLALFLYGMSLLSHGLQKAAGDRLRSWIEKLTNNNVKGVGVGALVTAVVQSSSITTVTLVGLINAGLLSLEQAIPVIMGANIGTTVTAQLIAFKVGALALPIIAVGFGITALSKKSSYKYVGQVILGFGLLFLGMNTMGLGLKPLRSDPVVMEYLAMLGAHPVYGISVGAIFTGLIQSSSATSGLVIAMASEGVIDLPGAIALVLGANIGTCVTVLLASIGSTLSSKRAALAHVLFNVVGVALFFFIFGPFVSLISFTALDLPRQVANAHLIFNVSATLILLPFVGVLVFAVKKVLPGKEIKIDGGTKYLDKRTLNTPSLAIRQAEKEIERMANMALYAFDDSIKAFNLGDLSLVKVVEKREEMVDELDNAIEAFLVRITRRELSKQQAKRVAALIHSISDIERVSDHANNIGELAERKIRERLVFSDVALKEIGVMSRKCRACYGKSAKVLMNGDPALTQKVLALEKEIDALQSQFEQNNFERMNGKQCNAKSSVVFAEVIRNLERVSDHSRNIALTTTLGF